jgi:hypothetical protein
MLRAMCGVLVLTGLAVPASTGTFSDEKCAAFAAFARMIMRVRQNGAWTLQNMLAIVDQEKDQASKDFEREIVLQAFEVPRFDFQDDQIKQADEYRDKVRLTCLRM